MSNMVDILSGERCLCWSSRCSTRRGDLVSLSFKERVSLMFSNMSILYIWAIESVTFIKVLPSDEVKNVVDGAVCWTIYEKFWKVGRRRCRHHCKALFSSKIFILHPVIVFNVLQFQEFIRDCLILSEWSQNPAFSTTIFVKCGSSPPELQFINYE